MSLFSKHIEKTHRTTLKLRCFEAKFGQAFLYEARQFAYLTDARQIAFHIGHETWHTSLAKTFGQNLQRYRFACTRSTSNQPMTVGHATLYAYWPLRPVGYV